MSSVFYVLVFNASLYKGSRGFKHVFEIDFWCMIDFESDEQFPSSNFQTSKILYIYLKRFEHLSLMPPDSEQY